MTANLLIASGSWAVLSNISPSLQTFALYGRRFGRIEPHFRDRKHDFLSADREFIGGDWFGYLLQLMRLLLISIL